MTPSKPRRAAGEGSIFKRADGMWVGSTEVVTPDGKRRQKRVYSRDYRTCLAKLSQLKKDIDAGVVVSHRMRVQDWMNKWVTEIHRDEVRPSTLASYATTVRHINSVLGTKGLDALTPEDVRVMIRTLGTGRRRTQKAFVLLSAALKDAEKEGIVRRNVTAAVHKPKIAAEKREAFTLAEARSIIDAARARGPRAHARWLGAFMTGLRQGEMLGLEWNRVDLDAGVADVAWQLQSLTRGHGCDGPVRGGVFPCGKIKGAYCSNPRWDVPPDYEMRELYRSLVLTRPKTYAGRRFVPLLPELAEALAELQKVGGENPHGLVFHRGDGLPVSPHDDWEEWQEIASAAGVSDAEETVPMHRIRHTTATLLRGGGVDEQTRMELLGHTSEAAHRVYAQADMARQREAMKALTALTEPEPSPGGG